MYQNNKGGKESRPCTRILSNMFPYAPKQKRQERILPYENFVEHVFIHPKQKRRERVPPLYKNFVEHVSIFFSRRVSICVKTNKGGKKSRPTRILSSMFLYVPKQKRRERIPPYGNFVEHVSIRAKTKKAGKNPALREFCRACFYTCQNKKREIPSSIFS